VTFIESLTGQDDGIRLKIFAAMNQSSTISIPLAPTDHKRRDMAAIPFLSDFIGAEFSACLRWCSGTVPAISLAAHARLEMIRAAKSPPRSMASRHFAAIKW
jgi:hypothetical protein